MDAATRERKWAGWRDAVTRTLSRAWDESGRQPCGRRRRGV